MENPIAMAKPNFNDSLWFALRLFKNMGPLGLAGLAILMGCGLFYVLMTLPIKAQINIAQQKLDTIQSSKIESDNMPETPANDISQDIAAINKMLPEVKTLHNSLGLIDKLAFKQGLRLNRGDYKFTQIKHGKVTSKEHASRYEIVLPVTGQYIQIRQFIANVLQSQPALALSSVKIQRENSLASNVEARLVFVLFLQGDSL
jgi:Tfp pilus assembly protein PilO